MLGEGDREKERERGKQFIVYCNKRQLLNNSIFLTTHTFTYSSRPFRSLHATHDFNFH